MTMWRQRPLAVRGTHLLAPGATEPGGNHHDRLPAGRALHSLHGCGVLVLAAGALQACSRRSMNAREYRQVGDDLRFDLCQLGESHFDLLTGLV